MKHKRPYAHPMDEEVVPVKRTTIAEIIDLLPDEKVGLALELIDILRDETASYTAPQV